MELGHAFLNDSFGSAMNQNIAFSGTPEIIHNGGTSVEWTASIVQGSWDFSTGAVITLSSGGNNDEASFAEETPTTIDLSGFTALTGAINLTTYNPANNSLIVQFDNGGVAVGNSINLNDFIDTGLLGTAQQFVVSKADMGLDAQLVDGFTLRFERSGGAQGAMTFDNIQLEQTGTPAVFKATTPLGTKFEVTHIRLSLADNITGVVTNGTMPGLAYNAVLGVSALGNGIVFRRVLAGKTIFSSNFKQLGDFLDAGNMNNAISDGTNTYLTVTFAFPEPIKLNGEEDSFLSIAIADDLSGLLQFTAVARGSLVI